MVKSSPDFIPRPLVRTNQWLIVLSVVVTWVTGWGSLLLIPFICGLGGLLFDFNPIMKFARLFLKKPLKDYIPEDKGQQKFNQLLASFFLIAGFISYLFHWTVAYYLFTIMVTLAAGIAICGFCVGCFILFQWKQFQYRRRTAKNN